MQEKHMRVDMRGGQNVLRGERLDIWRSKRDLAERDNLREFIWEEEDGLCKKIVKKKELEL